MYYTNVGLKPSGSVSLCAKMEQEFSFKTHLSTFLPKFEMFRFPIHHSHCFLHQLYNWGRGIIPEPTARSAVRGY